MKSFEDIFNVLLENDIVGSKPTPRHRRGIAAPHISAKSQHAVPDVRLVTGKRIGTILAENDIGGTYPEDMMNLMRQAVRIIEHLGSGNHKDIHNKRSLELTEAKIRKLAKYYMSEGKLPSDWRYKRDELRLMVE